MLLLSSISQMGELRHKEQEVATRSSIYRLVINSQPCHTCSFCKDRFCFVVVVTILAGTPLFKVLQTKNKLKSKQKTLKSEAE